MNIDFKISTDFHANTVGFTSNINNKQVPNKSQTKIIHRHKLEGVLVIRISSFIHFKHFMGFFIFKSNQTFSQKQIYS
jgi:hypothetical protein